MLFIVFGATLDMGYETRRIFRDRGFDIISKYNYVDDDAPLDVSAYRDSKSNPDYAKWYDDKIYIEKDQYEQLDYKYGLDGVHVGFNKQQILEAIWGTSDALLTCGASALEMMVQMKKAYGDYVTVINFFEDMSTVVASTGSMSEKEKNTRIKANRGMQRLYIGRIDAFDEIVLYTGEDSVYNMEALETQYDEIIKKRRIVEKKLNDSTYVELPYSGASPYIFVSYSHKDSSAVEPVLAMLQTHSYRVWYDAGIPAGENWEKFLKEKISSSAAFLLFSSVNSTESEEVEYEIIAAEFIDKKMITVRLDDAVFGKKIEKKLSSEQNIMFDANDFEIQLLGALPKETK